MAKAARKTPRFAAIDPPQKVPAYNDPILHEGYPLAWRFGSADTGGPFPWSIPNAEQFREVIGKLAEFEARNWNEITRGGSHPIETEKLCAEARGRLVELGRDDLDELVSLRLSGTNRVWCVKDGHILRPLWWDEHHQVYPVMKDKADRVKAKRRG